MRLRNPFVPIVISLLLAGCAQAITQPTSTATSTPSPPTSMPTPTSPISTRPASSPSVTPTADHTPTPSPNPPTSEPSPTSVTIVTPPPGLIYYSGDAFWLVGPGGEATPWSREDGYAYYSEYSEREDGSYQSDIWAKDRQTGEKRNLTNTPDRFEDLVESWSGRPDVLIFYSCPTDIEAGAGWLGYLSSIRTDGTGYSVLVESPLLSRPALSPDGQTIAYTTGWYELWLYRWSSGAQPLDVKEYGLEGWKVSFYSTAWSPDGSQLACWAWGRNEESQFGGILVLDLEAGTSQVLQPLWHPIYWDGFPPPPDWSPDGQWLKFFGVDEDYEKFGIWVVNGAGEVHVLAEFSADYEAWDQGGRAWRPDGRWLAFTRHKSDPQTGIWLTQIGKWEQLQTDLPSDARVVDWIDIEP
jgi:Tol biopolymer transport system component